MTAHSVKFGGIFGLLGPTGSGKTTTINIINGLSKPTGGQILVLCHDIMKDTRSVHAALRSVPRETASMKNFAWINMSVHADLYGIQGPHSDKCIIEMLNLVQLYECKDSRVSTYSGGMKRRLALARALLYDHQLLYLDEPILGVAKNASRMAPIPTVTFTKNYRLQIGKLDYEVNHLPGNIFMLQIKMCSC
jgi:ABC-2 type transport system ATP-binding protein